MARTGALDRLVAAREVIIVCGPGGVGKTTTAAAIAAGAALRGAWRALVLTVDPARRLADALGVELGNEPVPVDLRRVSGGRRPRGSLSAAMLDTGASWDALVRRTARSSVDADEILANPLYANLTRRFGLSHEYIAMERLYELERAGEWDLLVIDTPPSQNALDFLDAPERMSEFFSSPLLRWLIAPRRTRLVDFAARPFYQVADRLLGTQLLADVSRFFVLFNSMQAGFVERAHAVSALVRSNQTTFAVVSTLESVPVGESLRLCGELERRGLGIGLVIANRVLPEVFVDAELAELAGVMRADPDDVVAKMRTDGLDESDRRALAAVLREVAASFENYQLVAERATELFEQLARSGAVTARISDLADAAARLEGVGTIADQLYGNGRPPART